MNAGPIRAKIRAGLERAGRRTGGAPVAARLLKGSSGGAPTQWGGTGTQPASGGPYELTVMFSEFSMKDRMGTNISMSEVKLLIAYTPQATPENGDSIEVVATGEVYSLSDVKSLQPGGETLMWTARGAKGD